MIDDQTFQENVALWAKSSPKEALMLPYLDCSCFQMCSTEQGEPNLKRLYGSSIVFYHDPKGAAVEADQWAKLLPKNQISLIIVYGVGLGYYYDAILPWLQEDEKRYLIFLEDDLGVIYKLLETQKGTKILKNKQVQLLYFRDLKDDEGVLETLYWNFAMTRLVVTALGCYAEKKGHFLDELRHKLAHDAAIKNALVDEYVRYGGAFFINFYQNMLYLDESYLGNRFFGKFSNIPAIICGAGPSLAKNLPLLKTLQDKAVIFAGGSALNVLNAMDIQPHFGAGIDPNPMQMERLSASQGYEVPFFYRNRLLHDAFCLIHGPRLYITGSGGYDIAQYFEEKWGIEEEFLDEGHNVVNFCVQVAQRMGCNPIFFVGMDLAFTDMKAYAPGVVHDAAVSQSAILDIEEEDDKAILREDINGKPIYTLWKWIAEAEWLGDFAKEHPLLTMMNCTEGGLGFPGVINKTLQEAADRELKQSHELKNRIHGETQNSALADLTYPKIEQAMEELEASLKRSEAYLQDLIADSELAIAKIKEGNPYFQQSGKAALAEVELADEPAYKYIIDIFNAVYSRLLSRELHEINTGSDEEQQRKVQKLALNIKRLIFLRDVAKINHELISYAFKQKEGRPSGEAYTAPTVSHLNGIYRCDTERLFIQDEGLQLFVDEAFKPVYIPQKSQERIQGAVLDNRGHTLRTVYDANGKLSECYVECKQQRDGQYMLFYPGGAKKEEMFYREGKLHGPVTFWKEDGSVLAKSWFLDGLQIGKSVWYYPCGSLYSIQNYQSDKWHGEQVFYYSNGHLKSLMKYCEGKLIDKPLLLQADGSLC